MHIQQKNISSYASWKKGVFRIGYAEAYFLILKLKRDGVKKSEMCCTFILIFLWT